MDPVSTTMPSSTLPIDEAGVIEVADLVAQTAHLLVIQMFQTYMMGRANQLNSKQIAENRISLGIPSVETKEDLLDIQMVYRKLFEVTMVQTNVSPLLIQIFAEMNLQSGNDETAKKFVSTFVMPETHRLMQKLRADHPGALEAKNIWLTAGPQLDTRV